MINTNSIRPGTVNVLIGSNGSGKSRLLRKLCSDYLHNGEEVMAIAPTIYDRFRRLPKKGFKFFGARQGRMAANGVIQSALARASSDDPQVLKNVTRALNYTNFDPVIGIGLYGANLNNLPMAMDQLSKREADELSGALSKWRGRLDRDNQYPSVRQIENDGTVRQGGQHENYGVVKLHLDSFSYGELDQLTFAIIARYDAVLRRTKTIARVDYFLYRKREAIPLLDASSGEICFIATIAFIAAQIKRNSVIAIDEPDTSLHPAWQKSYVETLLNLFDYYQPRIVISTHSPIIVSGAEMARGNLTVYEMKRGEARKFDHAKLSLEEMYDRLFGLITPKNHYLSQRAVALLNDLNSGGLDLEKVLYDLEEMRSRSYDETQQAAIVKFEELAKKLVAMKVEGR